MPQFSPSQSKTARVPMQNPTAKAFDYTAELYMGVNLALMSAEDFHLEAGESKDVDLPVTMPGEPGTYPVYIGVFSKGESIALYKATEDVTIAEVGEFTVRIINYDELLSNSAMTGIEPRWGAQIPSSITYMGQPITYLGPSDGQGYRPLSDDCPFNVPEGSEFWNPYPYLSIWITAGPACEGYGWADNTCRSFGLINKSGPIKITPGCLVTYDYSGKVFSVTTPDP